MTKPYAIKRQVNTTTIMENRIMSKTDKLLAVLELTEDEQCKWLSEYFKNKYFKTDEWPEWYGVCDILIRDTFPGKRVILADLAIRLRDEWLIKPNFYSAMLDVQCEIQKNYQRAMDYKFWACNAKSIYWIIAALIAKNLVEEKDNGI